MTEPEGRLGSDEVCVRCEALCSNGSDPFVRTMALQISELEETVGSHQELLAALTKTYPKQVCEHACTNE